MWQWLLEALGEMLAGERHADVRTYAGDDIAIAIAASRRARRAVGAQGNRLWIWRDRGGLLVGDTSAPEQRFRFIRLRDQDDGQAFEVMLDENVDPGRFVLLRKPWPLRGVSVYFTYR